MQYFNKFNELFYWKYKVIWMRMHKIGRYDTKGITMLLSKDGNQRLENCMVLERMVAEVVERVGLAKLLDNTLNIGESCGRSTDTVPAYELP